MMQGSEVVVIYEDDQHEYLVMFDDMEDFERAEDLRKDFLNECDVEVAQGHPDRFKFDAVVNYWSLHGVIFTQITIDYIVDLYEDGVDAY